MSPTGRPEGESLARSDKVNPMSPTDRPEGCIFDMALARIETVNPTSPMARIVDLCLARSEKAFQ